MVNAHDPWNPERREKDEGMPSHSRHPHHLVQRVAEASAAGAVAVE